MNQPTSSFNLEKIFKIFFNLSFIFGFIFVIQYLSDVLIPFAIAALGAYLMQPIINFVSKWIKNHTLCIFISFAIILSALSLFLVISLPMVQQEVKESVVLFKELRENSELAQKAAERLPPDLWDFMKKSLEEINLGELLQKDAINNGLKWFLSKTLIGVKGLFSTFQTILSLLLAIFIISLYLFFILSDYHNLKSAWSEIFPESIRPQVIEFVKDFDFQMNRYFRGQALVAFLTGILFSIGFSIIGLPLGLLLGLFVGLLNMVPYLQIIAILPASFLALSHALQSGDSFSYVLFLILIVFIVVQVIQDAILVPRIMGKITGMSPAIILLSISIWGKILGLLGLLIAIPITCLSYAYYHRILKNLTTVTGSHDTN